MNRVCVEHTMLCDGGLGACILQLFEKFALKWFEVFLTYSLAYSGEKMTR